MLLRLCVFSFVISLVATTCTNFYPGAIDKLSRLSPQNTVQALSYLDDGAYDDFRQLTRIATSTLSPEDVTALRCSVKQVLMDHYNQRSLFMKILGLVSFYNIITVATILALIIFLMFLLKDIIIIASLYVSIVIIQLLFNGHLLKLCGIVISVLLVCFKGPPVPWLWWMYFFDEYSPWLGLLVFKYTSYFIVRSICPKSKQEDKLTLLSIIVGAMATLYHEDWLLGVDTVLLLYSYRGFFYKSCSGGYETGLSTNENLFHCSLISWVLVPSFIYNRIYNPVFYEFIVPFETGVMFWGTFVGLLCLLILSDLDYVRLTFKGNNIMFLWMQVLMFASCLLSMYFGTILNIDCLKNIGGTFIILWGLDLQRIICCEFKNRSLTFIFFMVFVNLAVLRYWLQHYPEYFILG